MPRPTLIFASFGLLLAASGCLDPVAQAPSVAPAPRPMPLAGHSAPPEPSHDAGAEDEDASEPGDLGGPTVKRNPIKPEPAAAGATLGAVLGAAHAYERHDGVYAVVCRDGKGRIWQLASGGAGKWKASQLTTPSDVRVVGDPYGFVRADKLDAVLYRDTQGHLHELSSSDARSWLDTDLMAGAAPSAAGDARPYVRKDGYTSIVYRTASSGSLYELFSKGNDWSFGDLTTASHAPAADGDPLSYTRRDGSYAIAFRADGHLHEIALEDAAWVHKDLTALAGGAVLASDPAPVLRFDSVDAIYYRVADGAIHEIARTAMQEWDAYQPELMLTDRPNAAGTPFAHTRSSKVTPILFRGTDAHVYELALHGISWSVQRLTELANAPSAAGDPVEYETRNGTQSLLYRGTDGHLHELSQARGEQSWKHFDLSQVAVE